MRSAVERPHWSYSALNQFLRCPLQFWFERVLKIPRRTTSEAQILGTSVHAALAAYHRGLQAGEPTLVHRLQEAFLACWDEESSRFEILSEDRRTHNDNRALGISLIDSISTRNRLPTSSPWSVNCWSRSSTPWGTTWRNRCW